jgi:hypothetical protein
VPDFPVPRMTRNPPGQGIDEYIGRSWEGGPALDVVVPDEPEYATLCEHCSVAVDWTVAEVEDKTRGYAIAVNDLGHVSTAMNVPPRV